MSQEPMALEVISEVNVLEFEECSAMPSYNHILIMHVLHGTLGLIRVATHVSLSNSLPFPGIPWHFEPFSLT